MKIIQFYDSFNEKGGVERVISLLLNHWCTQHETSLLIRQGTVSSVYPLHQRVQRLTFGHALGSGRLKRLATYAKDVFAIRTHAAITSADILIANGPWCGLLAILALKLPGLRQAKPKVFVCDHNSPSAFGRLTQLASRVLYRYADGIISLTQDQSKHYQAFAKHIHLIPNPIAPAEPAETPPHQNASQALAVGRLTRQKGFDLLLQAWQLVVAQAPDACLNIIGEGPEQTALQQQIQSLKLAHRVKLLPFTNHISQAYYSASFLVLSSRYEGLGLVILEAQAHGLPVVSFDCNFGPREIISHEENGLLCPPESPEALAQAILRVLNQPGFRAQLAEGALRSSKQYAIESVGRAWEDLFQQHRLD